MASDQPTQRPVERPPTGRFDRMPAEPPLAESLDWDAIERDADYQELRARRGRYIAPAAIICFAAYFGFLVLAVNDRGLLGNRITGGFTLGYLLMVILFLIVWAVVIGYAHIGRTRWDPHVERLCADARGGDQQPPAAPLAATGTSPAVGTREGLTR